MEQNIVAIDPIAVGMIGFLFTALIGLLIYIFNTIVKKIDNLETGVNYVREKFVQHDGQQTLMNNKLEHIEEKMEENHTNLSEEIKYLSEEITNHDRYITQIRQKLEM